MNIEYSIGIVAHIDRIDMAHNLSQVVQPKLVNVDNGSLGCAGNHGFVQARLAQEAGWSVILEEDAVPLHDFHDDLATTLGIVTTFDPAIKIMGLYLGTGYPSNWQRPMVEAIAADTSFIICRRLLHAVGYAIAPEVKGDLAEWMTKNRRGPGIAPDEGISIWANAHQFKVAYPNPSLVDHQDTPTVIRTRPGSFSSKRNRPRKAHNTRQRLTWTDSAVTMER